MCLLTLTAATNANFLDLFNAFLTRASQHWSHAKQFLQTAKSQDNDMYVEMYNRIAKIAHYSIF